MIRCSPDWIAPGMIRWSPDWIAPVMIRWSPVSSLPPATPAPR